MSNLIRFATIAGMISGLSACGGGGGGPSGGDVSEASDLNIGTTNTTASFSGLPFYSEDLDTENFSDISNAVVRVARAQASRDPMIAPYNAITDELISYDSNGTPDDSSDDTITLTIDGEPLLFRYEDVDFYEAVRGDQVFGLFITTNGEYSVTYNVFLYSEDELFEGFFAIGFETNPNDLPTTGEANYIGEFIGYGTIATSEIPSAQFAYLGGETNIQVDFETGALNGNLNLTAESSDEAGSVFVTYDMDFDPTTITGNGFGTTMTCSEPDICSSNSAIGGGFFGPEGNEISGVSTIDVDGEFSQIDGPDFTAQVIGVGGYTALKQ